MPAVSPAQAASATIDVIFMSAFPSAARARARPGARDRRLTPMEGTKSAPAGQNSVRASLFSGLLRMRSESPPLPFEPAAHARPAERGAAARLGGRGLAVA